MSCKEKLGLFLADNPNIELTKFQEAILSYLFSLDIVKSNIEVINFGYSADNEISLERVVPNVERGIFIGGEEYDDIYFVSYRGMPVKGIFLHIEQNNIDFQDIINAFTENL